MSEIGINYDLLGVNMGEMADTIVKIFTKALAKGVRPLSVMAWGAPGAGKTMTVYETGRLMSKALKLKNPLKVYANATSCLEPGDVAGVPTPVEISTGEGESITRYTAYLGPKWAYECSVEYEEDQRAIRNDPKWLAPPAILFFDDIVAAHFQTQTAFFKGVHEGHWGDVRARENVMVIAAGNRVEDNAGANDMPTALANRFLHLYCNPSTDDWVKWAQTQGNVHPFIIGYIRSNKGHLHEFDADVACRAEKAFASPRTWEMVSNILVDDVIPYEADSQIFMKVVAGLIGHGLTTNLLGFMRNSNVMVSPDEIIKNPKKAKIPTAGNLDALHSTIASLEAHLRQKPQDWEAFTIFDVAQKNLKGDELMKVFTGPAIAAMTERYPEILEMTENL